MNVAQLRDYMAEKVIPEKVMPQNIAEFLMDEEAELPELNAFTFLNRLRSLGIGSADFLYLLEGCGAPAEAIERIRRNPAMNLQSLIITLDGSGLTSQDYTRMLYTARQMWERTLTMRLENMTPRSGLGNDPFADTAEIETDGAERTANRGALPDAREEEALPADYTGELTAAENEEYPEPEDDPELLAAMAYYRSIFSPAAEEGGDVEGGGNGDATGEADESSSDEETPEEPRGVEYEEYPESYPDEYEAAEEEFEGTSEFVQIDADAVMRELTSGFEEPDEQPEPKPVRKRRDGGYHKGALVSAAVGAAAVFAAGAAVSAMGFEPKAPSVLRRAAEYSDVFAQTLSSYNAGILGGEPFKPRDGGEVLGGLLIEPLDPAEELGVFSVGERVYAAESGGISVYGSGEALSELAELSPPDGTEFIRVFERDGAVFAVFDGKSCGFMRIEKDEPLYIAEQYGTLTDIVIENGRISLGSVYLPEFTEDFKAKQTDKYVPETGAAGVVPAESVLLSGEGCGYAVSATYDTADGSVLSRGAVMGRAVFSAADGGFAALSYGDGFLLAAPSDSPETVSVGELIGCARAGELTATAERGEDGVCVYLRGKDLKPISAIKNLSEEVKALSFSGSTLLVIGGDGAFAAIDCADAENPRPLDLSKKTGALKDGRALCLELSGALLTYTLYDGGGAASSYSVTLSETELSTLETGGRNTLIISPERCGFAFDCFDGVCRASRYVVFGHGGAERTLFDDRTGFTAAVETGGKLALLCGEGTLFIE